MTLDVARLSKEPQNALNDAPDNLQQLQRIQGKLTLPLEHYHNHGSTITSAAMVHHNHPTSINLPQHFMESSNHPFDMMNPAMDSAVGRLSLTTFSPSNPICPNSNSIQVRVNDNILQFNFTHISIIQTIGGDLYLTTHFYRFSANPNNR